MNDFDESKLSVSFQISMYDKTHSFDAEYEDCTSWIEILDDLIKTLEAFYGYSFDLPIETPDGVAGVYYKGKANVGE